MFDVLLQSWGLIFEKPTKFPEGLRLLDVFAQRLPNEEDKAFALMDIEQWQQAWLAFVRGVSAGSVSLTHFRQFVAMGGNTQHKNRGLTLATIHAIKGLEFDIVFLMGMTEGTFPDYRATSDMALTEEKNNAYVAVTRARWWLFLSYPETRVMPWGDLRRQVRSRFIV